jgi:hypothetical protein
MFKLEHSESLVLIQVLEATSFQGKDVEMVAKLIGKIRREAEKTAPRPDVDVTTDAGWVDGA